LLLLLFFGLTRPNYLHWLAAAVFQEESLVVVSVGVFGLEVDQSDFFAFFSSLGGFVEFLAEEGGPDAFAL